MAIAYVFKDNNIIFWLTMTALLFSFLISYTRARAEGLGFDCRVGFFERPERLIILITSLITGLIEIGIYILVIGAFITTLQRIFYIQKVSK